MNGLFYFICQVFRVLGAVWHSPLPSKRKRFIRVAPPLSPEERKLIAMDAFGFKTEAELKAFLEQP